MFVVNPSYFRVELPLETLVIDSFVCRLIGEVLNMNTSLNMFVCDPNVIAQRTISSHMHQKMGDLNKRLTSPKRLRDNCVLQMRRAVLSFPLSTLLTFSIIIHFNGICADL